MYPDTRVIQLPLRNAPPQPTPAPAPAPMQLPGIEESDTVLAYRAGVQFGQQSARSAGRVWRFTSGFCFGVATGVALVLAAARWGGVPPLL